MCFKSRIRFAVTAVVQSLRAVVAEFSTGRQITSPPGYKSFQLLVPLDPAGLVSDFGPQVPLRLAGLKSLQPPGTLVIGWTQSFLPPGTLDTIA